MPKGIISSKKSNIIIVQMFDILILHSQLTHFKSLLESNMANGYYIDRYLFSSEKCKFLDIKGLRNFLTTQEIKNSCILNEIAQLSNEIITLWNDAEPKAVRRFYNTFDHNSKNGKRIRENTYFLPIELSLNGIFRPCYHEDTMKYFLDNYLYDSYLLQDICKKCSSIINTITAFYPGLKKSLENNKEYPFYCKVGALIAQGFVYKKGFDYFYKNEKFESASQLSKFVTENILTEGKAVRQYINDTLSESGIKNFYKKPKQLKVIISYCEQEGLSITPEFHSRYSSINN